jgi:hypothetical protein
VVRIARRPRFGEAGIRWGQYEKPGQNQPHFSANQGDMLKNLENFFKFMHFFLSIHSNYDNFNSEP